MNRRCESACWDKSVFEKSEEGKAKWSEEREEGTCGTRQQMMESSKHAIELVLADVRKVKVESEALARKRREEEAEQEEENVGQHEMYQNVKGSNK
jgi:hypothetical protein